MQTTTEMLHTLQDPRTTGAPSNGGLVPYKQPSVQEAPEGSRRHTSLALEKIFASRNEMTTGSLNKLLDLT